MFRRKANRDSLLRLHGAVVAALLAFTSAGFAQDEVQAVAEEELAEYEVLMEEEAAEVVADVEFALPADPETVKVQAHLAVHRGLIRRVCDLTPEQTKTLSAMDNQWLAKISKENELKPNAGGMQPGLIGMFFGVQPQRRGVVQKQNLKKKVGEELLKVLTDDQKKQYEAELSQAKEFRSAAIADALLAKLQERLDLTDPQLAEIKKKMIPWVSRSDLVVVHYFNGNNYYPDIPMHLLDPLTDEQRKVYQGLQRHLFTHANFNDGNVPIVIEE